MQMLRMQRRAAKACGAPSGASNGALIDAPNGAVACDLISAFAWLFVGCLRLAFDFYPKSCNIGRASAWHYVTQSPQGRNAARVSGLWWVRGGFLYSARRLALALRFKRSSSFPLFVAYVDFCSMFCSFFVVRLYRISAFFDTKALHKHAKP